MQLIRAMKIPLSLSLSFIASAGLLQAKPFAHLFGDFISGSFRTHLGQGVFTLLGEKLEPLLEGVAVLASYWLILFWMYRRKLFLRI